MKRMQTSSSNRRSKKPQTVAPNTSSADTDSDDDWATGDIDTQEPAYEWLETSTKEKDASRIRRQMEARRNLEIHMEAKRLKSLIEDWAFD